MDANAIWTTANFSGGLVSEFREFPLAPGQNKSGAVFSLFHAHHGDDTVPRFGTEFITMYSPDDTRTTYYITMCFTSLGVADRSIDASSGANRTEPVLGWSVGMGAYDAAAVTAQLSSGHTSSKRLLPPSPEERGIMGMKPPANLSAPQSAQPFNDGPSQVGSINYLSIGPVLCLTSNLHIRMPYYILSDDGKSYVYHLGGLTAIININGLISTNDVFPISINLWLSAIFTALFESHSSAVALQGVITSLAGIKYYGWLDQLNKSDSVDVISFVDLLTPGGALGRPRVDLPSGLVAVVTLLVFHLLLLVAVVVRFWMCTTVSRIGDNWQAIAQVALSKVPSLQKGLKDAMAPEGGRITVSEVAESSGKVLRVRLTDENGVSLKEE